MSLGARWRRGVRRLWSGAARGAGVAGDGVPPAAVTTDPTSDHGAQFDAEPGDDRPPDMPPPASAPASAAEPGSMTGAVDGAGAASPARPVPVIWLLGKTGAGKSSLVRAMTGASAAEIGNGFVACTRTARAFAFPAEAPVLRFLDTRGLGEVAHDPGADLAEIRRAANVVLVLMRLDDPVQGMVLEALRQIRGRGARLPLVVVHTAPDRLGDAAALARMQAVNQHAVEQAWGVPALPQLVLDLADPALADLSALHDLLAALLPGVVGALHRAEAGLAEEAEFLRHRKLVLGYVGSATAGGALPGLGLVSVPGMQLAMIAALAARYEVVWDRRELTRFAAALGGGVLGGQALGLGARELAKLVPVLGQTVAPVVSAGLSAAATWALGRAAGYYLFHLRAGRPVDEAQLRGLYAQALKRGADAAD